MDGQIEPPRVKPMKPLGRKTYGSIPHLLGSNRGPADKGVNEGQHRICTEKCRKGDTIIIQEKLDGSCVSVAKQDGKVIALSRAGYHAETSPYEQHHLFVEWVGKREGVFFTLLEDGERIVGEWLAQAHGTKYNLKGSAPFVPFDIMRGSERVPCMEFYIRVARCGKLHMLPSKHWMSAISIDEALAFIRDEVQMFESSEGIEGVIYRVENKGKVDFLAKYVRNDFVPGKYLPEISGGEPVWNWAAR